MLELRIPLLRGEGRFQDRTWTFTVESTSGQLRDDEPCFPVCSSLDRFSLLELEPDATLDFRWLVGRRKRIALMCLFRGGHSMRFAHRVQAVAACDQNEYSVGISCLGLRQLVVYVPLHPIGSFQGSFSSWMVSTGLNCSSAIPEHLKGSLPYRFSPTPLSPKFSESIFLLPQYCDPNSTKHVVHTPLSTATGILRRLADWVSKGTGPERRFGTVCPEPMYCFHHSATFNSVHPLLGRKGKTRSN